MHYLLNTPDGKFTLLLSVAYFAWAVIELVAPGTTLQKCDWNCNLALFFMPVLLLVVFVRQRLGTDEKDRFSIFLGMLNASIVAIVPFSLIWTMAHAN
jgi:hypothetical protein